MVKRLPTPLIVSGPQKRETKGGYKIKCGNKKLEEIGDKLNAVTLAHAKT